MPAINKPTTQQLGEIDRGAFEGFDKLPESANVRVAVVAAICGVSKVTIWRWTKSGRLPAPRRLSEGVTAWNVGELRQHVAKHA